MVDGISRAGSKELACPIALRAAQRAYLILTEYGPRHGRGIGTVDHATMQQTGVVPCRR